MVSKEFLGAGWKFPVSLDGEGRIALSLYEQDIREAIWIILCTARGERVMRPDFGCGIHELVFESINATTIGLVESNVKEALTVWEPRIELQRVDVNTDKAAEGLLLVSIDYRVRRTNNRFNLVYPFYMKEGASA
ncbi:MAG TPA: GPW/gp25 family protein [Candidatus Methanoperedenaceae archaeon]|nr:GPW/gp25 family protein [Candidatus Methanoperedenaceae archaeon]